MIVICNPKIEKKLIVVIVDLKNEYIPNNSLARIFAKINVHNKLNNLPIPLPKIVIKESEIKESFIFKRLFSSKGF